MKDVPSALIVAAHPDDEVLGCGGTVARLASEGAKVTSVILGEGAASRHAEESSGNGVATEVEALRDSARRAAEILGAAAPIFFGLPDNQLDSLPTLEIVQRVEGVIADLGPSVIFTHSLADLNIDHRVAHQAVVTASRPVGVCPVMAIYAFETQSSTEWGAVSTSRGFSPVKYVDISGHLETKLDALKAYESEMRDFPHPRSFEAVDALAKVRGSHAGFHAAEAFEVILERH